MLKRTCHFYNTTGKCRFGKNCKFSHDKDPCQPQNSPVAAPDQGEINVCETGHNLVHHPLTSDLERSDNHDNEGLSNTRLVRDKVQESNQNIQPVQIADNNENLKGSSKNPRVAEERICKFYARSRFCRYGKRCIFRHVLPSQSRQSQLSVKKDQNLNDEQQEKVGKDETRPPDSAQADEKEKPKAGTAVKDVKVKKPRRRVCRDFKAGDCHYGSRCRYYHPPEVKVQSGEEVSNARTSNGAVKPVPVAFRRQQVFRRDEITEDKLKELRKTEIQQLQKRFPSEDLEVVENSDERSVFIFNFSPSDPDWPYDVQMFRIKITFGADYPEQVFEITILEDEVVPDSVQSFIQTSIREWLEKKSSEYERKQVLELLFRPFLRWLDRSIEGIVTEGLMQLKREVTAQSYGFEFIPAKPGKPAEEAAASQEEAGPDVDGTGAGEEQVEQGGVEYRKTEKTPDEVYTGPEERNGSEEEEEDFDEEDEDEEITKKGALPETERRGTELHLRNMQLQWHVGTMFVEKLFLIVQCERCKFHSEFSTPPHRVSSVTCAKCRNPQYVKYRPVLAHHYSDIIGYLDLDGCAVHDCVLQKCVFTVACYTCNRTYSCKTLLPGILHEAFCQGCHNKLKFSADSVRFNKLLPSEAKLGTGKVHRVHVAGLTRAKKDPAIQEGRPLPDNGACKHYKKSFRWLRFPCCGKCYPCDLCHDEKETDHDMKWATRMICGFCCKEQAYAGDKACIACGGSLTKSHTAHWEGGKGCRNKVTMSRDDAQKYSNLNKTVSNRAMSLLQKYKAKKKKT